MPGIAVVTGPTHGIGQATALGLARAGFDVVLLARNTPLAEDVARAVRGLARTAWVMRCDLASLASVRGAAQAVATAVPHVDVLVNNAGMMPTRRAMTVDGFEESFAVNQLAPFLLTHELLPIMPTGRIVNVASAVYRLGRFDAVTIESTEAPFSLAAAYAQSKLANVAFTLGLAERLHAAGRPVTVNCLHPGVVATHLLPDRRRWQRALFGFAGLFMRSPERGARTSIHLATSPVVTGVSGRYFDARQRVRPLRGAVRDPALRDAIWQFCASRTGVGA